MNRCVLASGVWIFVSVAMMGSNMPPDARSLSRTVPVALAETWTKTWGGSLNEAAHNTAVDPAGNVYVIGEYAGSVDFDPDPGNTDLHSSINGTTDAFLSKFDANGALQWAKTWGGGVVLPNGTAGRDVANGLAIDGNGNVYVSGAYQYTVDFNPDPAASDTHTSNATSGNTSANNIYLSKFAADGAFQWVKTWGPSDGGAESYSLAWDEAGYVYVVGDFSGTTTDFNPWDPGHPDLHTNHPPVSGPVFFDSFLSKFDANGNFQWAKTWGGEGYDDGPGVGVDGAGNVYVGGMYASKTINFDPAGGPGGANHPASDSGYLVDVFLSKFTSGGTFQWVRTWGGQGAEDAGDVVMVDGANNVYLGGRFACKNCDLDPGGQVELHSSNGEQDAFISKFDPAGNFLWARTWGGTGWDSTGSLAVDGMNNVYVTGFFVDEVNFDPAGNSRIPSNGGRDVFFNSFTPNGVQRWTKTWGGGQDEIGWHLAADEEGNFYVAGSFSLTVDFDPGSGTDGHTSNGKTDAFLTKFVPVLLPESCFLPLVGQSSAP